MTDFPENIVDAVAQGIRSTNHGKTRGWLAESEANGHSDSHLYALSALEALVKATGGPDHIVFFDVEGFTLQHPITERLNGSLFDCEIHHILKLRDPDLVGTYRVWLTDIGVRWAPLQD